MKQPSRIVISHVYSSENKGDAALTSVLISDIKQQFPRAKVSILTLDTKDATFEGIPQQPAFMYFALNKYKSWPVKLAYTLFMVAVTLLWAAWFRATGRRLPLPQHLHRVSRLYAQADLIIGVGGGYIRSRKGFANRLNIPLLLHPLLFGHILGKPTVLYSQSVGPFTHAYEGPMVAFVLKRLMLILLREDTSVALLARYGVSHNVMRAVDSGFLLRTKTRVNIRAQYRIPPKKLLVGVTVRSWLQGAGQTAYEQAVAGALDNLVDNFGVHVLFIPQVTAAKGDDDRVASRRVLGFMRNAHAAALITETPDHHHIKALYDGLDVLLGTRFHSVIFSLTSMVPVLAIEYEHKTSGIMRDLKLTDWVVDIHDVTALQLTNLLQKLLRERTPYRAQLHEHIPPYVERARQTIGMVADSYRAATDV